MSLETNLIFLIIFGVIGFIIEKIWGINPYNIYEDGGRVMLLSSILFLVLPAILDYNNALTVLNKLPDFFIGVLPSSVVGDFAGSVIAKITGKD